MRTSPTLPIAQQLLFLKRLSLYLHAGVSVTLALSYLKDDAISRGAKQIYTELERTILQGLPLSRGLERYPRVFDTFTTGFIRIGEASGTLTETLERLSTHIQKRQSLRSKVMSALLYPCVVLAGTLGITLFLAVYIFPKLLPVLQGFHSTLPLPTRILIHIDSFIQHDWPWILGCVGLLLLAFVLCLHTPSCRRALEYFLLRVPIVGTLTQRYALVLFSRTLSIQLSGGIRILPSLALARSALPGQLYAEAILQIEQSVASGLRLSDSFTGYPRLFPSTLCQLVHAGEMTGTLSENLAQAASMYEEELDELTRNFTVLIEPVLMVIMGCMVGGIALAIITPIYHLTQSLTV
jgi:type IV pilus assembly protein PilC